MGKTIHIRWVRSGIGFSHRQKTLIRSLGFRRLNQVVERPDSPQTHGLIARLAHLVEIVDSPQTPMYASVAEYTIRKPQTAGEGAANGKLPVKAENPVERADASLEKAASSEGAESADSAEAKSE